MSAQWPAIGAPSGLAASMTIRTWSEATLRSPDLTLPPPGQAVVACHFGAMLGQPLVDQLKAAPKQPPFSSARSPTTSPSRRLSVTDAPSDTASSGQHEACG